MAEAAKDIDFLEFIVKNLVDHPEDVKVDRQVDEMGVLLSVKVNPEDMGQLIGKQGSTAKAIRNLIRIIGLKNHARVNLKIEEPEGGSPRQKVETEEKPSENTTTEDFEDFKI
ncbi:MAG: KH domain-containing protein [Candidatus Pacebacteria bacterium]|nr:KH domain-containing protein [Candidatus Paceibacterota bacterium]MDD5012954.1 KH domain-containing protein [Candidatus Paceibacterota bacterium]MDD5752681.1 KH domain-containing protein [Candidatus Paceibacterota bacterium]